jgi:hypothetical protein
MVEVSAVHRPMLCVMTLLYRKQSQSSFPRLTMAIITYLNQYPKNQHVYLYSTNIANFLYDWSENSAILLVDNNKYNNTE